MVGVESSGYRMGTRVSLNAIIWVPTIVGHYSSPILRTSNKLDNGPAACVPIIPQEQASQISPIHLPHALYSRWQGGEEERGEQSNYNDDDSGGYVGGNGNDDDGNSDDGNGDDGNGDDGNGDYNDDDDDQLKSASEGQRRRWRW